MEAGYRGRKGREGGEGGEGVGGSVLVRSGYLSELQTSDRRLYLGHLSL